MYVVQKYIFVCFLVYVNIERWRGGEKVFVFVVVSLCLLKEFRIEFSLDCGFKRERNQGRERERDTQTYYKVALKHTFENDIFWKVI